MFAITFKCSNRTLTDLLILSPKINIISHCKQPNIPSRKYNFRLKFPLNLGFCPFYTSYILQLSLHSNIFVSRLKCKCKFSILILILFSFPKSDVNLRKSGLFQGILNIILVCVLRLSRNICRLCSVSDSLQTSIECILGGRTQRIAAVEPSIEVDSCIVFTAHSFISITVLDMSSY